MKSSYKKGHLHDKLFRLSILLTLVLTAQSVSAYSGGTGISGDPYLVSNAADLQDLMNTSGDWGAHFLQATDISAAGLGAPAPIGNNGTKFTGTYDGGGYSISGAFQIRYIISMGYTPNIYWSGHWG